MGIVAYISAVSFFTYINMINATAITKIIIRQGSVFFLLLLLRILPAKFLYILYIGKFIVSQVYEYFNLLKPAK